MLHISGHLREFRRDEGFAETEKELVVNCCGYQKILEENYERERLCGRVDYQIIYIAQGCGEYMLEGEMERLGAGRIVLYKPGEPQLYKYSAKDMTEVYWIHFTGFGIDGLLEHFRIKTGYVGENPEFRIIFKEMITELQLKKAGYTEVTEALFRKLIVLFGRAVIKNQSVYTQNPRFEKLIITLNQNYKNIWKVKDMADLCHLSEGYFSHYFKENMGCTPMQYLLQLRMKKAKELLAGSNMSVTAVAEAVGYDDQLYFSRVFKQQTGVSPSVYQREKSLF